MSQNLKQFVEVWVEDNIKADMFTSSGHTSEALMLADRCRSAAKAYSISSRDVDTAIDGMIGGGDGLEAFLGDAIEVAAERDPEVAAGSSEIVRDWSRLRRRLDLQRVTLRLTTLC